MKLSRLGSWRKVALSGGILGLVGFALPWFEIYGQPRAGATILLGSGGLSQHATPALLMVWSTILGLILLAVLSVTYLTLAPAWRGTDRPRARVVAASVGAAVCLLLSILGFAPGLGYWATFAGSIAAVVGNLRADGLGLSTGSATAS